MEVQVRVRVSESYVRLDTVGGARKKVNQLSCSYICVQNIINTTLLLGFLFMTATSSVVAYLDDPA